MRTNVLAPYAVKLAEEAEPSEALQDMAFNAFESSFQGGVRVAASDLGGDGIEAAAQSSRVTSLSGTFDVGTFEVGTLDASTMDASGVFVVPPDPALELGTEVSGTNGNDIMFQSSASWETLLGLGGNDVFVAAKDKATNAPDTWDGGSGINTGMFTNTSTPVNVNLASGTASRAYADDYWGTLHLGFIDLINIQDVVGSAHGDTIQGDAGANTLWGHDGDDYLYGGAGNDTLDGGQGNDVLRGGAGVDVIRGGPGADQIRWHVGDLGRDEIEGFVLGEDEVAFGDGFLVTADPADSLFVVGSFGDSILMADTIEAGWQEIAIFRDISDDALQAAINNGILFGYEVGPVGNGGPGGLVGPVRPEFGRGGGTVIDDVIVDGPIVTWTGTAGTGLGDIFF